MKRVIYFFAIFFFVVMTLGLSSCGDKKNQDPEPMPIVDRTVLVYMVAANNLGQDYGGIKAADSLDIKEMQIAAKNGAIKNNRWIVYHSTYANSKLYELTASELKLLKEYPSGLSVSIDRMTEVINDTKKYAPANNYGMVLWSHASGWIEDGIEEKPESDIKPMSYGIHSGKKMNLTSLRRALQGKGIDYIYFDCCLMGSIEVAYELRECARYIISSPSELPRDGMPYDENMRDLLDGSRDALIRAATNTFNLYANQPNAIDRTCTMTIVDTEGLDEMAIATKAIYELTPYEHPLLNVTNYYGSATSTQADYLDFGEYVEALCSTHNVDAELLNNFNNALNKTVIYKAATEKLWNHWPMRHVSGLSTRVFNNQSSFNNKGYNQLQWATDVVAYHITQ